MVFIKIKILWAADSSHADKQPTGTEKTLARDMPNEGLVSKLCKELWQLNNNKINILILKWAKYEYAFIQRIYSNFHSHTEKFSTSIANGGNANRGLNETGQTPHPLGWPSSQMTGKCWLGVEVWKVLGPLGKARVLQKVEHKVVDGPRARCIYTLGKWDHVSTQTV